MSSKIFLAFRTYFEQGLYDNIKFGRKDFADDKALETIPDGTMNDASTQSAKLHNSQSIARGDYFFRGNCISFERATRKKQQQVLVVTRQIEKLHKKCPLNACLKSGRTADLAFGTLRSFKRINVGVVTLEFGVLSKRDAMCKR